MMTKMSVCCHRVDGSTGVELPTSPLVSTLVKIRAD